MGWQLRLSDWALGTQAGRLVLREAVEYCLLGLVADSSLCTCHEDTARGGVGQRGKPHDNQSEHHCGAVVLGGVAAAGLGLAAPAQAGPSYWHYCPGHWEYTVPVPAGTDLRVCHWFAVTVVRGPSGPVYNFVEVDQSQVPPPAPGFPWP